MSLLYDIDSLADAIETALIHKWVYDMTHFNAVSNYLNNYNHEQKNTIDDLYDDQSYFRYKAQQLEEAFNNKPQN